MSQPAPNDRRLANEWAGTILLDQPRFFMLLDWSEALAIALDHGASTEAEDKAGKLAIMWAFTVGNWAVATVTGPRGEGRSC